MKATIQGVSNQMDTFQFLFNLLLSELILRQTDKLSQTLQTPALFIVKGHEVAMLTVKTLQTICSDSNFDLFWDKVKARRVQFDVEEPVLSRRHKRPQRYEKGISTPHFPEIPKDMHRPKLL